MALARNKEFRRPPLPDHASLGVDTNRVHGPVSFLNPTAAHFEPASTARIPKAPSPITYKWTSRNNRKGRHAVAIDSTRRHGLQAPPPSSSIRAICRGILSMFIKFPIWDVSYDVAVVFTFGSVVWVINAFFVFLPLVRPQTEFRNEILYGGGITAFIGATIFELGSFLLMAEAVNESRTGCFGWALERAFSHTEVEVEKGEESLRLRPAKSHCTHHHLNKRNLLGKGPQGGSPWVWFPTKEELLQKYFHELGFLASLTQLFAATIFWVSGFTALPGIYNNLSSTTEIVFYWTPQVIGGMGFVISGTLFMLETQPRWYQPALGTLGWHIGFWNLIGGIGFTLCPCFGYDARSWAQYQASLSTFWGSWAFLVGSVIQWYESLSKFPVEIDKHPAHRP